MQAIVNRKYGPPEVLALEELERPAPGPGEVLVRVRACSVNPADWHFMRGEPYLLRLALGGLRGPKPSVRGLDLAGVVEAVGADVTQFKAGDEVFGGLDGALAEYACGPQEKLAHKPAGTTFEQAAAVPIAGSTALQALRDHGRLQSGQGVLINGAAGGVGTFAVQIAKALGGEVTGVCATGNVAMVASIGADHVNDYTKDDFVAGQPYDLIVDNVGNRSIADLTRVLTPTGTLVLVGAGSGRWLGPLLRPLRATAISPFVKPRLYFFVANVNNQDLATLADMLATGSVTPVIDRSYPLADAADAIRYLETGHAKGKIIITV